MKQNLDYTIELAKLPDAERISQIESECFSQPWTFSQISEEIQNPDAVFICAKSLNDVLGYVSGRLIFGEFYISNIAVDSVYRNCRIGSALMSELIEILKCKDCTLLTLEVRESNINARKLYEKAGFCDLGIRKGFYSMPKEDAHIYTLYIKKEGDSV